MKIFGFYAITAVTSMLQWLFCDKYLMGYGFFGCLNCYLLVLCLLEYMFFSMRTVFMFWITLMRFVLLLYGRNFPRMILLRIINQQRSQKLVTAKPLEMRYMVIAWICFIY
jgi:hypothetical protein